MYFTLDPERGPHVLRTLANLVSKVGKELVFIVLLLYIRHLLNLFGE